MISPPAFIIERVTYSVIMGMKVRFPLLLVLLGIVFLASACVSFGLAHNKCLQTQGGNCNWIKNRESEEWEEREVQQESQHPWSERGRHESEQEQESGPREQPRRRHQGQEQERPRYEEREQEQGRGGEEEEEEPWGQQQQSQREREREPQRRSKEQGRRGRGEEEEEGEEKESESWRRQPQSQREKEQERQQRGKGREQEEEEGDWRGEHHHEDPEERERVRRREPRQRGETGQRPKQREPREEREGLSSQSQSRSQRWSNPFHFSSNRFKTRYKNRNGHIRVLQRFDQRSSKLQNLQNYRIVEYESRPNTLVLPHHSDADYILVVLKGRATAAIVKSNDKQAYNLEPGDVLRLPAGTTAYILNRDDDQNLRVVKLAIPVNKPGQFDDFFPSSTENQQSYFRGFSRNTLEAAFNTRYEEIQRILLGEEEQDQEQEQEQQSQEEGVIVKVTKEQIKELSRHAQSSSRRGKHSKHSESGPFNLRSNKPVYSNKFGNFYEITPDKNPQLEDLELSLSYIEINEGALMLPHYNSEAIEIVVVSEGKGNLELVGLREQQQQQQQQQQQEEEEDQEEQEEEEEEKGNRQVQRYRARLSPSDTFVIPASYPISVNASSNLYLLGFGINAENNQRNFLAGENDNVISQLDKQVKEIAFPGSAQDVEWLINNQQQSYFASAQPQQSGEGRQRRKGPLSSILGALY